MGRNRRYRIELTQEERTELTTLAERDRVAQRAHALLLLDEGDHGPGLSHKQVCAKVGFSQASLTRLCKKTDEHGAIATAHGSSRSSFVKFIKQQKPDPESVRHATNEEERRIATDFATGKYSLAELGRREGFSRQTIRNIVDRTDVTPGDDNHPVR